MARPALFFVFMCGTLAGYLTQQDWLVLFERATPQVAAVSMTTVSSLSVEQPDLLTHMTLEQKVGQLLMIGHWKQDYYQHTKNMLQVYGFGGVIIMSVDNDLNTDVINWTRAWQSVSDIPLLISIDQEGGTVTRLQGQGFIQTSQREITSPDQAYDISVTRGRELENLGINVNLVPVIDFASSSDSFLYNRSFASSTQISTLSKAVMAGHTESGVLTVPKHFPGHADTTDDSHFTLPIVDITAAEFPAHVAQFKELLATTEVDALMKAHVQFPKLDDQYPATLSYEILSRQLRRDLGFEGVIITDDMTMGAITNQWSTNEAAVQAIQAGADIILFAAEPNAAMAAHGYIVNAVKQGELNEELIDQAVIRTLKLKQKQGLIR